MKPHTLSPSPGSLGKKTLNPRLQPFPYSQNPPFPCLLGAFLILKHRGVIELGDLVVLGDRLSSTLPVNTSESFPGIMGPSIKGVPYLPQNLRPSFTKLGNPIANPACKLRRFLGAEQNDA